MYEIRSTSGRSKFYLWTPYSTSGWFLLHDSVPKLLIYDTAHLFCRYSCPELSARAHLNFHVTAPSGRAGLHFGGGHTLHAAQQTVRQTVLPDASMLLRSNSTACHVDACKDLHRTQNYSGSVHLFVLVEYVHPKERVAAMDSQSDETKDAAGSIKCTLVCECISTPSRWNASGRDYLPGGQWNCSSLVM